MARIDTFLTEHEHWDRDNDNDTRATQTGEGKMTVQAKAKEIVNGGMNQIAVFSFFDTTNKDVVDYIALFGSFGVSQSKVWDMYEDWQNS